MYENGNAVTKRHMPPHLRSKAVVLPTNVNTATPPVDVDTAAPPTDISTTILPTDVSTATPPTDINTAVPTKGIDSVRGMQRAIKNGEVAKPAADDLKKTTKQVQSDKKPNLPLYTHPNWQWPSTNNQDKQHTSGQNQNIIQNEPSLPIVQGKSKDENKEIPCDKNQGKFNNKKPRNFKE